MVLYGRHGVVGILSYGVYNIVWYGTVGIVWYSVYGIVWYGIVGLYCMAWMVFIKMCYDCAVQFADCAIHTGQDFQPTFQLGHFTTLAITLAWNEM
jgi:hypothetical protein